MNWLRLHHEARTDKKLASLNDAQFRVWFNLLCFSGEQPVRGMIEFEDLDLLAIEVACGDTALLTETIGRLVKLRILGDDANGADVVFLNFEKRQYDKPSDSPERVAERVRKHRERQCNANVTPSNAIDTDAELDTDAEAEGVSVDTPPRKRKRQPKAPMTSVPDDLVAVVPEDVWDKIGNEQGMDDKDLRFETAQMTDYYRKTGKQAADWIAAWRSWMRSELRQTKKLKPLNGHAPPGNGNGYKPKFNAQGQRIYTLADLREDETHDHERDSQTVVEAASRVAEG